MSVKRELRKIAEIVGKQQQILTRLAQQVVDTSRPTDNKLDKLIHDATLAWSTQAKMSAQSSFEAGTDGKNYQADVTLNITDPRKPVGDSPAAQATRENFKRTFLSILQNLFSKESQNSASPLFGSTATFNINVK